MNITVYNIFVYPIKGLSGQHLERATLARGHGVPGDRRFALRHAQSTFDPGAPAWQRKSAFLMLAHTEALAALDTTYDAVSGELRITRNGAHVFSGEITSAAGRAAAGDAVNRVHTDPRGPVTLVDAGEISLTDSSTPCVSILNLASVRDLAAKGRATVDPARFRANVIIDGLAPWAEFDWIGRDIRIGPVTLKIAKRIERCAATTVNPTTAARDLQIPALLQEHYGHIDCGVFGDVVTGGEIAVGDAVTVPSVNAP